MVNQIIKEAKLVNNEFETCLKQSVYAYIHTINNEKVFGSNKILNKIEVCPREEQKFKTGEGYHLCKDICQQESHAEIDAINNAIKQNINIEGATLYLVGHTYCCDNCISYMIKHKIKKVIIYNNDNSILNEYELQPL